MTIRFKVLFLTGCIFLIVASGCTRLNSKQNEKLLVPKGPKIRTAIVGFDIHAKTYGASEIDKKLMEMLSSALFKTGRFDLIERKEIERVFKEQEFQLSGMVDPATAVKIGKILGVRAIVTGAVTEVGFSTASFLLNMTICRVSIDVRIIDVETARILAAETGEGRSSKGGIIFNEGAWDALKKKDMETWIGEALREASEDVARKIDEQMINHL